MTKAEQDYHLADKTHEAAHHVKCAKADQAEAERLSVSDPAGSAYHSERAKEHTDRAEHCVSCCEKIAAIETNEEGADHGPTDKVSGDRISKLTDVVEKLLTQVQPLPGGLSIIPRGDRPELRPRTGQRTEAEAIEKSGVDPTLANVIFDESQAS